MRTGQGNPNLGILKEINENKAFIFVHFDIGVRIWGAHHGLAALTPIIRRHGFKVHLIHMRFADKPDLFAQKIRAYGPAIVGFTSNTSQFKYLELYSKAISHDQHILQIAGGVHPTLDPEGVLLKTAVDGVCVGEGEYAIDELLTRIEKRDDIIPTKGFYWRNAEGIVKNPLPDLVGDLSALEFPDYSIFDRKIVASDSESGRRLIVGKSSIRKDFVVVISRGCRYNCSYCCNSALRQASGTPDKYYRLFPLNYAIRFLKHLLEEYPETQYFAFEDDLLLGDERWFLSFAQAYKEQIRLPYELHARPECVTPAIVNALKDSGCLRVRVGLESGDENIRREYMNRYHSNDFIAEKCKLLKDSGISIMTLNMMGLPFEGREEMKATYGLNKRISPEFGSCLFFRPYPKTPLHELCEQHGLLKTEEEMLSSPSNYTGPFIKMPPKDKKACLQAHLKMTLYFFKQGFRCRCREFLDAHKGMGAVLLLPFVFLLMAVAVRVYCVDLIRERFKILKV